jgi:hypothetical protein
MFHKGQGIDQSHGTAAEVYDAFHNAIDAALDDSSLQLDAQQPLFQKLFYPEKPTNIDQKQSTYNFGRKQRDTIFLSVASYRDENCGATVESAFKSAETPELLTVGVVEQNCHTGCLIGTGWAETRRIVPSPPDVDCVTKYCKSPAGRVHCTSGRVKLLRLNESESYGPLFARFVAAKQWTGQEFFVQVDSHTDFKKGWDRSVKDQLLQTPSFPHSVISNYPPNHESEWEDLERAEGAPNALCSIEFRDNVSSS